MPIIYSRIWTAIRQIPSGTVSTYGAVGRAAGYPRAARQVAAALRKSVGLPWHRVLGAGGEIKTSGHYAIDQRLRLQMEGVSFRGRRVDMAKCEFKFPGKRKSAAAAEAPRRKKRVSG